MICKDNFNNASNYRYKHLSTNIVFKDAELKGNMIPQTLEPIQIKYPTYMKIIKYTKREDDRYDLVENIYRQDMTSDIESRKVFTLKLRDYSFRI